MNLKYPWHAWILIWGTWAFVISAGTANSFAAEMPEWQVNCSLEQSLPGHVVRISAQSSGNTLGSAFAARGWGQRITLRQLLEESGKYEGFLAIPLETAGGYACLTITAVMPDFSGPYSKYLDFNVLPYDSGPKRNLTIKNFKKYNFAKESREVAFARNPVLEYQGAGISDFEWPVVDGNLTGKYGTKRVYNGGIGSWYHSGIDISSPLGTPIYCPADGKVTMVRKFEANGNTTIIDHGFGVTTTYLHQKVIQVQEGDLVKRGQVIGEVGSTGASLGPHLHFQVNVNGIPVDPSDMLRK